MAQTSLNISLPEEMKQFVEAQVARGGFSTPSEYVRELIRDAQRREFGEEVDRQLLAALRAGHSVPMELVKHRLKGKSPQRAVANGGRPQTRARRQ